jgi:hypothetical protein
MKNTLAAMMVALLLCSCSSGVVQTTTVEGCQLGATMHYDNDAGTDGNTTHYVSFGTEVCKNLAVYQCQDTGYWLKLENLPCE